MNQSIVIPSSNGMLRAAVEDEDIAEIKRLLQAGAVVNSDIRKASVINGRSDIIKLTLEGSSDTFRGDYLLLASQYGGSEMVKFVLDLLPEDPTLYRNAIMKAAEYGNTDALDVLKTVVAERDFTGMVLSGSVASGKIEPVKIAVEYLNSPISWQDGCWALIKAKRHRHSDVVTYLSSGIIQ